MSHPSENLACSDEVLKLPDLGKGFTEEDEDLWEELKDETLAEEDEEQEPLKIEDLLKLFYFMAKKNDISPPKELEAKRPMFPDFFRPKDKMTAPFKVLKDGIDRTKSHQPQKHQRRGRNKGPRRPRQDFDVEGKLGQFVKEGSADKQGDLVMVLGADRYTFEDNKENRTVTENFEKTIRSALNKLTMENLSSQHQLIVEEVLSACGKVSHSDQSVETIFDIYSSMFFKYCETQHKYADVFAQMTTDLLKFFEKEESMHTYRDKIYSRLRTRILSGFDEFSKNEKDKQSEEQEKARLNRVAGTMTFLGQLCSRGFRKDKQDPFLALAREFLSKLVKLCPEEFPLRGFNCLLENCGAVLDKTEEGKKELDEYFKLIEEWKKVVSARFRFMMMDLVELRGREWAKKERLVDEGEADVVVVEFDTERGMQSFHAGKKTRQHRPKHHGGQHGNNARGKHHHRGGYGGYNRDGNRDGGDGGWQQAGRRGGNRNQRNWNRNGNQNNQQGGGRWSKGEGQANEDGFRQVGRRKKRRGGRRNNYGNRRNNNPEHTFQRGGDQ